MKGVLSIYRFGINIYVVFSFVDKVSTISTRHDSIGNIEAVLSKCVSISVSAALVMNRLVYDMNYEYVGDVDTSNQSVTLA